MIRLLLIFLTSCTSVHFVLISHRIYKETLVKNISFGDVYLNTSI